MSYRDYFNIDPEYFPQVDKQIIDSRPDLWKKFYPHPSFVRLLEETVNVLSRRKKLALWVSGAYGTGKSHAVLTLKKLLEATEDETQAYFEKYKQLSTYLLKNLVAQKNAGKILVCHRYGSSDISEDTDLILAIQEGIEKTLAEHEIENKASASLRNSLIRYFENEENKQSFNVFASGSSRDVLGGDMADDILEKLRTYREDALRSLVGKLFKVPHLRTSFVMNVEELCDWIKEVLEVNNIASIVFIWDEFSEYFENNMHHLTGFQKIAELSATAPFYLMIVTHKGEGYFSDGDSDKKKILDRFVDPIIHISLPENIAFELMAQAMKVTDDPELAKKWEKNKASLNQRTNSSRSVVRTKIELSDEDLSKVLPIHPYAALLLQHISIYYTSTARSMFNFIKTDNNDLKAFQWFIDNYDFSSENPFVTIDMLWDFFYENGRDKLATGIKDVLSCYTPRLENELLEVERRVLKTILLLQAVSERMSGDKDIFLPNEKNLNLAFEGSDLGFTANNIAKKLLRNHVITRTPLTGDVFSYCCRKTSQNIDPSPFYKDARAKTTKDMSFMVPELRNVVELSGALKLRYNLGYTVLTEFDGEIKKANNPSVLTNKFCALVTIARNVEERTTLQKKIKTFYENNKESNVVVIDASSCILDKKEYEEFVENIAMALAIGQSDGDQRRTYEQYAHEVLKKWAKKIAKGDFYVYSKFSIEGVRVANSEELYRKLAEITKTHYPQCLEGGFPNVVATMYDANALKNGALCGITEETKNTFRSGNETTKLETALKGAWKQKEYWKSSHSYIAMLKTDIDEFIQDKYKKSDRISIAEIYEFLKTAPYGFMPCNLTAFVLGFLLKEYANTNFSYCDGLTTIPLTSENLALMISDIIKLENTPDKRYRDKYIVTLTEEERAFNNATSQIFNIDEKHCISITETRSRIREQMKGFSFPIWLIEYSLENVSFKTTQQDVLSLIGNYCGIANNMNMEEKRSDNDIALTIGRSCINNPGIIEDLKGVLTKENCKNGMLKYLESYKNGQLPILAKSINDGGQYINHLAYKFNSDAANWVWNKDTVHRKIDELITEYEIVEHSNKVLSKTTSYGDTIQAWRSKLDQVRIAYSVMKTYLGEAQPLYEMLYSLKKSGTLLDSQKETFLDLLKEHLNHFKNFMSSQSSIFMKACDIYLDGLVEEDVCSILEDDKYDFIGQLTTEPNVYMSLAEKSVLDYKNSLGWVRLKKQWEELTDSTSPYDWSLKHKMPIQAMVPSEEDSALARKIFGILNSKRINDSASIVDAEEYILKMSYLKELNSKTNQDDAFVQTFLSGYETLIDDVDEVRKYLSKKVTEAPFYWMGNREVNNEIDKFIQAKYLTSGYEKAKKIVDAMPSEQVKDYLKKLISENVIIGIEFLKR